MIRRRRQKREIPFSFDSFLDVVANVVGIIIRLILVAWVGARSYSSVQEILKERHPPAAASLPSSLRADPLELDLARSRRHLAEAQARLLEQLRQLGDLKSSHHQVQAQLTSLTNRRHETERQRASLDQGHNANQQAQALTLVEIQARRQRLMEEIQGLEKLPPLSKTLHYRTPVSRPVLTEELMFECRGDRVAFIDIAGLIADIKSGMEAKTEVLQTQWQVADVTHPIGAFRLRYTIERQRGALAHRLEQIGLILEMPIDGATRYTRRHRDLAKRGFRHAMLAKYPLGSIELSPEDEHALRRRIVERALAALRTEVAQPTIFGEDAPGAGRPSPAAGT